MKKELIYSPTQSYLRVATACPQVSLADVPTNTLNINDLYLQAVSNQVSLIVFPELSLTGYTLGDLVQQTALLIQAERGLELLAKVTKLRSCAMVVGLPLRVGNGLYSCAALLADGVIKGIVPKINLPTYNEFYEDRWFQTWQQPNINLEMHGKQIPFGNDLLFDVAGVLCGIEICEDLWVARPPSARLAEQGARIILNPSASPEQIGKAKYRHDLVQLQSAKLICGYLYAGCDTSESTSEIVMGGHQIIAVNGNVEKERKPFGPDRLLIADVDIEHLDFDRRKQHMTTEPGISIIKTKTERCQNSISSTIERNPFLPLETIDQRNDRLNAAVDIQAYGLAMRMQASHQERVVIGLSGGLDSTLALLIAFKASKILKRRSDKMIHTLTMPGLASSDITQSNAQSLASELKVINTVIPINKLAKTELAALKHDENLQDVTYENIQARARTSLLFNYANQHKAMVLGTGDLSEIALGWCTYNADQQSHYNVNATIPKTLVRSMVEFLADQSEFKKIQATLQSILDTPISPELTSNNKSEISQSTENIIGPYELHDFFLYHLIRWGDKPAKIIYFAKVVFTESYSSEEITQWFNIFIRRFSQSQFKRETLPNGPKVGSVSLSPRGDWRMPPDLYNAALWKVDT